MVKWHNIYNGCYGCSKYCSKLFKKMTRKIEFRQYHCRNFKKKVREKKKISNVMGREIKMNFGNEVIEILVLSSSCSWSAEMLGVLKNQLWQWHCWNMREKNLWICGDGITKIGRKKWQLICANDITEI